MDYTSGKVKKTQLPKIIVILGPTASGKSDLALRLSKLAQGKPFKKMGILGGEIISADSRQVYREMNIGTGKVKRDGSKYKVSSIKGRIKDSEYFSEGIKHYLIDVASPKKQFTVSDFKRLGKKALKEILGNNKLPIIAGGTGFYIDALLDRIRLNEIPPNKKLRANLEKKSAGELFKMLEKSDSERSKNIDRHNKRRLIRALEISLAPDKPIPSIVTSNTYQILWLGINPDKEILAKKIKNRLEKRLKKGMIREVDRLHKHGVSWKRLYDFGLEYRWISLYLKGDISYSEMKNLLLRDIIKYSKRQKTWFKKNKEIHWIKSYPEAVKLAKKHIS